MRQDVQLLSSKIDAVMQLCKNVLEYGEKIRMLNPLDIGMEAYADKLVKCTEDRGRATRVALKEIKLMNGNYETIEKDSTATPSEKAFLHEKIRSVKDLSPLFAKQGLAIKKIIEAHLKSLRKESIEFHQNVGVIRNYLKTPDKRTFYG